MSRASSTVDVSKTHLPAAVVLRTYLLRGVRFWIYARLVIAFLLLISDGSDAAVHSIFGAPGASAPQVVGLSMVLCAIDVWMRKERALLGNLAISAVTLTAIFVAAAVAGELALYLLAVLT